MARAAGKATVGRDGFVPKSVAGLSIATLLHHQLRGIHAHLVRERRAAIVVIPARAPTERVRRTALRVGGLDLVTEGKDVRAHSFENRLDLLFLVERRCIGKASTGDDASSSDNKWQGGVQSEWGRHGVLGLLAESELMIELGLTNWLTMYLN